MKELTVERIAKWHPDWSIGGNKIWSHIEDPLPGRGFPRWLDPESNDWVELLEALDHNYAIFFVRTVRGWRCDFNKWDTERKDFIYLCQGMCTTKRESFLAALAQLLDAQGDG